MEKETARIEAFSDGVFAIAITLLVLDLHLPESDNITSGKVLLQKLAQEWPSYSAFALSFFSIFIMWVNHHKLFKQIYQRNTALMFANGLILFFIALTSHTTALLARYYQGSTSSVAVAIYTGMFVCINLSYNLLWHIASRNKALLRPDISDAAIHQIKRNYLYGTPAYVFAFIISFYAPAAAVAICMLLWLFWALSSGKINLNQ